MNELNTQLAVHEAQETEKWKRQDEINESLKELVEKNTDSDKQFECNDSEQ